jgi:hypothetical protein
VAGGLSLLPDEFLVQVARDRGLNTQRLTLTTHRLIHSRGITSNAVPILSGPVRYVIAWHVNRLTRASARPTTLGQDPNSGA